MRARAAKDGLTVRLVAGTDNILLAMDLQEGLRAGCLGFSIERTDLDNGGATRWLPNMIKFPTDAAATAPTTARAPLQAFRWGDYTVQPGHRYRYRIVTRTGSAADILAAGIRAEAGDATAIPGGVTVEIAAEDNKQPGTAVFFNRGAAASKAYNDKFGNTDPQNDPAALIWLSRGLEEALLDYLGQATGPGFGLHAVIYEFQKPNLLDALGKAKARGADVQVVYHARQKTAVDHAADRQERAAAGADDADNETAATDKTKTENEAAIKAAKLDSALGHDLHPRAAAPQGAIMHDKYVVLLKAGVPIAVWTGSTNWTDGAIYGQLNVGHAVYDPAIAAQYEESFQLLKGDPSVAASKAGNARISTAPANSAAIPHGIAAIFSPQSDLSMINLYADICAKAKLLLVSAPFLLHQKIRDVLNSPTTDGQLRYVMADKPGSFGSKGGIQLFNGDPGRVGVAATVLKTKLNDFQGKLLERNESFHHAGVHVHSKIILADPFGADPILVTGSANFSTNSTVTNDSNSLIFRGDTAVADIYATEFMRMFQHYWLRFRMASAPAAAVMSLDTADNWQKPFYDPSDSHYRDRIAFVG
jgi:hypothetical protein